MEKIAILFKDSKYINDYEVFKNNNKNFELEFDIFSFSSFESKSIYKIVKDLKLKGYEKVFYFHNYNYGFDLFFIKSKDIFKINSLEINSFFIFNQTSKNEFKFKNIDSVPRIYKEAIKGNKNWSNKNDAKILIDKNIYIENNFKFQLEKLKTVLEFEKLEILRKFIKKDIGFNNNKIIKNIKFDKDYFSDFIKKIENKFFDGKNGSIKIEPIKKENKSIDSYDFSYNYGTFKLDVNNKNSTLSLETNFYSRFNLLTINADKKLLSTIRQFSNPVKKTKISKRNILLTLLSFTILAITLWLTFGVIYNGSYDTVFDILGYGTNTAWFYILIANFFVSVFYSMLLMMIFNYIENQKFNWKNLMDWFFVAQVRFFVLALTGNHILSLFFYSLYLNKRIKISTPKIGGMIGASFIFRGIIHLASGFVFVSIGFGYLLSFNLSAYGMDYYLYLILILAFFGLFFSTSFSILSGLVVVNEKLHNFYSRWSITTKMYFNKKIDYFEARNSLDDKSYELKISSQKWLKNRKLLWRIGIGIFSFFIFEAIETMAAYDITIHYVNDKFIETAPALGSQFLLDIQYNFIKFAGLRSLVKNANDFLPFIPFGYVEYLVNGLYQILLWENILAIDPNIINNPETVNTISGYIDTFSTSTTFITMFFGKYMRLIFSFFIFDYFIFTLIFWKIFESKKFDSKISKNNQYN